MENFLYEVQSARVVFGAGMLSEVKAELQALGGKRALIIATNGKSKLPEVVADLIGELCAGIHREAVQHVPIEVVEKSFEVVKSLDVDSLIAIGGGSSIGLAKAIALVTSLPIIAIPTTYAGSEMTPIWGITDNGIKKTGKDLAVRPKTVIYDPELTITLPAELTVTSAMNALAHCIEGLYAENKNPIITLLAEEGIRAICSSLPKIVKDPADIDSRSKALYGCWLGGTVLGSVGMALHHKLCHVLGGSYNLPHAETHTVVLPYALWYNADHIPEEMRRIARALGTDENDAAGFIFDLVSSLGAPTSLASIGMKVEDLDEAAKNTVKNPYFNPRPIDYHSIRQLLDRAFRGERPTKRTAYKMETHL